MKTLLFTLLALSSVAANAQVYKCAAETGGARLTNSRMFIGARSHAHALHGDVDQVAGGTNIRYHFPEEVPRWLVCQYGGKRVDGTAISGPDVIGARESWIQLDPMLDACELKIREFKPQGGTASTWTAEAACTRKQPPPPDMV